MHNIDKDLLELTQEVNSSGSDIAQLINDVEDKFKVIQENKDVFTYLVLGAQVLDFLLIRLSKVFKHAVLFDLKFSKELTQSDYLYSVNMKLPDELTLGRKLGWLRKNFRIDELYPDFYKRADKFIKDRNTAVHDLIEKYRGDIKQFNLEKRNYLDEEVLEGLLSKILDIQEEITKGHQEKGNRLKN